MFVQLQTTPQKLISTEVSREGERVALEVPGVFD